MQKKKNNNDRNLYDICNVYIKNVKMNKNYLNFVMYRLNYYFIRMEQI